MVKGILATAALMNNIATHTCACSPGLEKMLHQMVTTGTTWNDEDPNMKQTEEEKRYLVYTTMAQDKERLVEWKADTVYTRSLLDNSWKDMK